VRRSRGFESALSARVGRSAASGGGECCVCGGCRSTRIVYDLEARAA
jgi:hypothetical protein